ncbi:MAG: hypothetical protein BAA03_04695 [Caldibacillus debilis]|nr:MAG: hypothetical protein BAA03_04695 [Caldibacillus debilis]
MGGLRVPLLPLIITKPLLNLRFKRGVVFSPKIFPFRDDRFCRIKRGYCGRAGWRPFRRRETGIPQRIPSFGRLLPCPAALFAASGGAFCSVRQWQADRAGTGLPFFRT